VTFKKTEIEKEEGEEERGGLREKMPGEKSDDQQGQGESY